MLFILRVQLATLPDGYFFSILLYTYCCGRAIFLNSAHAKWRYRLTASFCSILLQSSWNSISPIIFRIPLSPPPFPQQISQLLVS
jgi:hypothetical protein